MAVKIIYFVHGTTTDNTEHKSTGWIPGELTEKGIQQSIDLKNQINLDEIDDTTKNKISYYEKCMDEELTISNSIVLNNLLK